ncbi:hypothetical protein Bhyg_04214 [Pseudolycoriella hygida]|uniref:Uncharacterized protein n=1 Tax=Pseudolycoriella hygida TaxID=35572 RepID=A0A9Q0S881_9DIPT|nr:hypothetical protein Bhyg_04214 [Pseudolycoriella hygida]
MDGAGGNIGWSSGGGRAGGNVDGAAGSGQNGGGGRMGRSRGAEGSMRGRNVGGENSCTDEVSSTGNFRKVSESVLAAFFSCCDFSYDGKIIYAANQFDRFNHHSYGYNAFFRKTLPSNNLLLSANPLSGSPFPSPESVGSRLSSQATRCLHVVDTFISFRDFTEFTCDYCAWEGSLTIKFILYCVEKSSWVASF